VIVAESQPSRRLVGQLDRGLDLVQAVSSLCHSRSVRSGVLRAFGSLADAEVCRLDDKGGGWLPGRRVPGPSTILHLGGHVSERLGAPHLELTCALLGGSGEVTGGRLVQARVHAVELVIDCFDDLVLTTDLDEESGLWGWVRATSLTAAPRPEPAEGRAKASAPGFEAAASGRVVGRGPTPAPAAPPPAGPTWAPGVAASASRGPVDSGAEEADDSLRAGDVIDHPRFGAGEVERIEGAGDYAQVRLRNNRLVRLSLDVVQLVRDGNDASGKRRFKARVTT